MNKKKKVPLWGKILIGILIALAATAAGLIFYVNYLYGQMNIENQEQIIEQEETFDREENKKNLEEDTALWNDSAVAQKKEQVINILIAGEEAMHSDAGRGRTDSIMIVTLNKKEKTLKVTSIMRDSYVQIPGHSANKINAAYGMGGMPLLKETVEENFDLKLDGYILVGFDGFEQIVDSLGGVKIPISKEEAEYLNRTDYIDNKWNQNLYAGILNLNGDQALGYARVRYVNNGAQNGDFGRTERHREILMAIFDKLKDKNLAELLVIFPDMLKLVTTNLTRTQCIAYLTDFVSIHPKEMETFRIPTDEGYKLSRANGMSVVMFQNLNRNNADLHDFIFGKKYVDKGKHNPNMMLK
ncbi:MAG: LCP family protein [Acetivibrio sp.]